MKIPFLDKNKNSKGKVAVGLSGGVDSAVAAYLLKEQGYDVTGVYMQCWDSRLDGCTADEDRLDALKVATHIKIPFKFVNFVKEYKERVISHFYEEYQLGRTPNPDVLCNKEIKFGMFLDWAMKKGFDYVATGHYARINKIENASGAVEYQLLKGLDDGKDQSYFLYLLNQEQLSKSIFPVGEMEKTELRRIAHEVGFHNADKKDSVGICFIGDVDIREFLADKIDVESGNVVNKEGEVIGTHDGVQFYTIGQRHGFQVKKYHGLPLYVIGKNVEENELIVGYAKDGLRDGFEVEDLHWIGDKPEKEFKCKVRIRHLGEMYPAKVEIDGSAQDNVSRETLASENIIRAQVHLTNPIFGVAPGQSVVFYDGDLVLGGGIIV